MLKSGSKSSQALNKDKTIISGRFERVTEDLKSKVIEALKTVEDPELGIDVWNLGLIYDVSVSEGGDVSIKMTFTAPGCPASTYILFDIYKKLSVIEGIGDVRVDVVLDPRWTPLKMTQEGRKKFELKYGYDIVEKYLDLVKSGKIRG
ncbi:MAG: metal-sulfur cluster assembly factor [Zestosphaera sp.]